jgi:23S rRNA pseudouridine1911/1915/1917 synthase
MIGSVLGSIELVDVKVRAATMIKTLQMEVNAESRLDRVVQQLTGLSRAGVRGLLENGCVSVGGQCAAHPQSSVIPGDIVRVEYDPHRRYKERPKAEADPAFEILFEDDHLIVVNKAAHVLTVPTASGKGKTLIDALERHINRGKPPKVWRRLHVVHRLDQGVSGVLVVAKSAKVAEQLKGQFAAHKPQRTYIAIVKGIMERKRGTFRSYLATDYSLNRYSTKRPGHGELAITHYEVISHGHDATVVRVQLETGRRNQIRVHFAEAGHPVLGDPRYPRQSPRSDELQATSDHPKWRAKRQALHAASLECEHPVTHKRLRFEAPLPSEFQALRRESSSRMR